MYSDEDKNVDIPKHLSIILLIHFLILLSIGVPLLIEPKHFLAMFGVEVEGPTLARAASGGILCAAITSLQLRNLKIYEAIPMLLSLCYFSFIVGVSFLISMISSSEEVTFLNIVFIIMNFGFGMTWLLSKDNYEKIKEKHPKNNTNDII